MRGSQSTKSNNNLLYSKQKRRVSPSFAEGATSITQKKFTQLQQEAHGLLTVKSKLSEMIEAAHYQDQKTRYSFLVGVFSRLKEYDSDVHEYAVYELNKRLRAAKLKNKHGVGSEFPNSKLKPLLEEWKKELDDEYQTKVEYLIGCPVIKK